MYKKITNTKKTGRGMVNSVINRLPFEMHLPGYQYCGPGTKLKKRLQRGDPGVNELDKACKMHDIAYDLHPEKQERKIADLILIDKARKRIKSKDASLGEKIAATTVAGIMTAKNKIGAGLGLKREKKKIKKVPRKVKSPLDHNLLKSTIMKVGKVLSEKRPKTVRDASRMAVKEAKAFLKKEKKNSKNLSSDIERIIPVPKIGGILPLIPIFAGLSALGALAGGSAAVANAVVSANNAKKQLTESERHNRMMEAVAIGANKRGRGVFLRPYKSGFGVCMHKKINKNAKNY